MPQAASGTSEDIQAAKDAGLRYEIPGNSGIERRRSGSGYAYVNSAGKPVHDEDTLNRIRSLVIPPAWTAVRIAARANAHIQAVGRDAKGRKQYRYHPDYRAARDLAKFSRMLSFGKALPRIRRIVSRDLGRKGMPKRKVLAAVVKLLETTFIRIGNEEYAEENGSFGLTTLRNQHVEVLGGVLKFKFRGKSGQQHEISLQDKRLAKIVRRCKDIPGRTLFEYIDDEDKPATLESGDVNEYLRDISGGDFSAKDFRTWGGTCLAANYLLCQIDEIAGDAPSARKVKSLLVDVVKDVAAKLGNKPATCKKYYIHPVVMESFSAGVLKSIAARFASRRTAADYEQIVLALLAPVARRKKVAA